eukprot:7749651-Ditylum_brightwellii.AAC.1
MAQILTAIRKCKWLSDQPLVTYSTASKGSSPFAVPELYKELIDATNEQMESIEAAVNITVKEIQDDMYTKPTVPNNNYDFMLQLKCYANLCYGLFDSTDSCTQRHEPESMSVHHVDIPPPVMLHSSRQQHNAA